MNKEMGQRPFYAEMGRLEPGREGTGVAQRENTPGSHGLLWTGAGRSLLEAALKLLPTAEQRN